MKGLALLDLESRITTNESDPTEFRAELRIASTGALVAWFRLGSRISDGEKVVGTSTQFVHRRELSVEQINAAKDWLRGHMLSVIQRSN